jgi:hypothetical protein
MLTASVQAKFNHIGLSECRAETMLRANNARYVASKWYSAAIFALTRLDSPDRRRRD